MALMLSKKLIFMHLIRFSGYTESVWIDSKGQNFNIFKKRQMQLLVWKTTCKIYRTP